MSLDQFLYLRSSPLSLLLSFSGVGKRRPAVEEIGSRMIKINTANIYIYLNQKGICKVSGVLNSC